MDYSVVGIDREWFQWFRQCLVGGFEVDFSSNVENVEDGVQKVSRGLLQYGVTSFCPTIVTSPDSVYKQVTGHINFYAALFLYIKC